MSNLIDLTLLTRETVDIKFAEDVIFTIPVEPTLEYSTRLLLCKKKMQKAKTDEQKLDLVREVVTLILSQDGSHDDVKEIVGKLHSTQIIAVFNIYDDQVEKNKNNPN